MGKARWRIFYIKFGLLFLATLLFCHSGAARADQDQRVATVYAVGSSIRSKDMSAGRNEAIADSLVVAVTQVLNDLMPPETVGGHFQVLSESVLSHTDRFIADYQMLTEATHGSTHRVMVKATVSVQRLKDALKHAGIVTGRKQLPQVLYCIAEKRVGDMGYQYWWSGQPVRHAGVSAETFVEIAQDKGFGVVTPRMDASMGAYPPELSVSEAVALGQQMQAEVVVVGQAVAEEVDSTTIGATSRSFRAVVAARAYSVRNGREIGQTERVATVTGEDPGSTGSAALSNAAQMAGEDLTAQMAETWYSAGVGGSAIELSIEGLSGHIADFVRFRGALSSISGVNEVQRKEMQSGRAVLLVNFQGSARSLVEALMRLSFDAFGLNIAEPEGNTIRVQIVPK